MIPASRSLRFVLNAFGEVCGKGLGGLGGSGSQWILGWELELPPDALETASSRTHTSLQRKGNYYILSKTATVVLSVWRVYL